MYPSLKGFSNSCYYYVNSLKILQSHDQRRMLENTDQRTRCSGNKKGPINRLLKKGMASSDIEINSEFIAFPEQSYGSVLKKGKTFSKIPQNSQENSCIGAFLLTMFQEAPATKSQALTHIFL